MKNTERKTSITNTLLLWALLSGTQFDRDTNTQAAASVRDSATHVTATVCDCESVTVLGD